MPLLALPAFNDNYIWALADGTGAAVIVDPGEAGPVLATAEQGLRPIGILLTHHHNDHIGGTQRLLERWPGLPVYAPDDDRIACAHAIVGDGAQVRIADWRFDVIAIPGHTRSHIAFHLPDCAEDSVLFCGDTLFSLGCGRLFEGTPAQMHASLARLATLPGHTRICCGHEYTVANAAFARVVDPDNAALRRRSDDARAQRYAGRPTLPSMLADELACNPFLRVDTPGVRAALQARLGRPPTDAIEAFAELRRWKDGFTG